MEFFADGVELARNTGNHSQWIAQGFETDGSRPPFTVDADERAFEADVDKVRRSEAGPQHDVAAHRLLDGNHMGPTILALAHSRAEWRHFDGRKEAGNRGKHLRVGEVRPFQVTVQQDGDLAFDETL